jgi:hypothetical protein
LKSVVSDDSPGSSYLFFFSAIEYTNLKALKTHIKRYFVTVLRSNDASIHSMGPYLVPSPIDGGGKKIIGHYTIHLILVI